MNRAFYLGLAVVFLAASIIYFSTQVNTVYGGDAGDFLAAIITNGISHPPGYPLFTVLGILVKNIIPFGTLAYKTAFLSTIPAVGSLTILYLLLNRLTGRVIYPLLSTLILAFSYTFWLYSVVVEVFSLNNLFLISLVFTGFVYAAKKQVKYLYLLLFLLGLSFSHQHIILFAIPPLCYLILAGIRRTTLSNKIAALIFFISGLTPYIYVFLASKTNPSVNWMGEPTGINFINLIFRTTYGTFQAGRFINQTIISRFLNLFGSLEFIYRDLTPAVIILNLIGIYFLFRTNKRVFRFFILAFLSFLFFLFYASFPLYDNFMLATFERFILPVELILTIPTVYGFIYTENLLAHFYRKYTANINLRLLNALTVCLFATIPPLFLYKNYAKISILKNDFTAENFAADLLKSVGNDSILILSNDTPLFDTQYLYYSQKRWPKVKLIHFSKLNLPFYLEQLKRDYPDLKISAGEGGIMEAILTANNLNIYTKQSFSLGKGQWLPWGLVYKYLPAEAKENPDEVIEQNERLWRSYQNPLSGSLAHFGNLFLTDVLKSYLIAHQEIALYEAQHGRLDLSQVHLTEAKKLDKSDPDSFILLSQVYIKQKKCNAANAEIAGFIKLNPDDSTANLLRFLNYSLCFNDQQSADRELEIYRKNEKGKETPLRRL